MIRSKSSAKCSAADLAAEFSRRSLAAGPGHAPTIGVVGRICGTTWKSSWRRQLSVQRRRLRLRSLIPATNATAAAPNQARVKQVVPRVPGADKWSVRVGSFISRNHVHAAAAQVRSSRSHAGNAVAKDALKRYSDSG